MKLLMRMLAVSRESPSEELQNELRFLRLQRGMPALISSQVARRVSPAIALSAIQSRRGLLYTYDVTSHQSLIEVGAI